MVSSQASTVYYYSSGERIPLIQEPSVYAVKFKPGKTSRDAAFSRRTFRFLREDSAAIGFIPHYGLQVYQSSDRADGSVADGSVADGSVADRTVADRTTEVSARSPYNNNVNLGSVADSVSVLSREAPVEFAAMAYRRPIVSSPRNSQNAGLLEPLDSSDLLFFTQRFMAQFKSNVTLAQIKAFNAEHQVDIVEALDYADNGYLLKAPEADGDRGALSLANVYYESDLTLFSHPDYIWRRHFRATAPSITAPSAIAAHTAAATTPKNIARSDYLAEQWHLKTAKVIDAWNTTKGSDRITIAILDDGTDTNHPEFAGKVVAEYDFASNLANGNPKTASDSHGTACAGVATAKGVKAFGAAPDCQLMAVRTPNFLGVADEANMFRWVREQGADIISCSWGPADGTGATDPLPDNVRAAIHDCVTHGRGGKGIPIFWAAGNGDESVSLDGYAANPEVMAIAASTSGETRSWYSDFGPEIWVCAPSSGDRSLSERRIFTTDRLGSSGYNSGLSSLGDTRGDYTNDFGGTSSATPLVAGIAGLILSVNESLTVSELKDILKRTADKIGQASDYDTNGHSDLYGYGRVNAQSAVEAARGSSSPTAPSIQGPTSLSRADSAPTFDVNTGGRQFFAIEVATRANLFDATNHQSDRTDQNFYGTWQEGPLLTRSPYRLPAAVWTRLKLADRLYYRAHVADSSSWTNYAVTVGDSHFSSAPAIEIVATTTTPEADTPSIQGPVSLSRTDSAPTFDVNTGGRQFFAIEVATRANLFDATNHQSDRTGQNFYGTWQEGPLLTRSPYRLPAAVWTRLKSADRLYYRAHVADSSSWTNYAVTVGDSHFSRVPVVEITGNGGHGNGVPTAGRTVVFPSGASFSAASEPEDIVDYSDPVGGGRVPLIEVGGRLEEKLSTNFKVKEFAAKKLNSRSQKVRYARVSPDLVAALQKLRDRLGASIVIDSAYRYLALNRADDDADHTQHVAGYAVDIRSRSASPTQLAQLALEELGCNIGIGLDRRRVHLDLRGTLASWTYPGAAMDSVEFDRWVQEICDRLDRSRDSDSHLSALSSDPARVYKQHSSSLRSPFLHSSSLPTGLARAETLPTIVGPERYSRSAEPPTFLVNPGRNAFFAVEVASHWQLFDRAARSNERLTDHFFASWQTGLHSVEELTTTYTLPESAWQQLRLATRLYYRVVTASANTSAWMDYETSTTDQMAAEAAWIDIVGSKAGRSPAESPVQLLPARISRLVDESRWRG